MACKACGGVAVIGERCIGHLDVHELESYGERVAATGLINGRGAHVDADVLFRLVSHARKGPAKGVNVLLLDGARITGGLMPLRAALFASFKRAEFMDPVTVLLAAGCPVDFADATFRGDVSLQGEVAHDMRFAGARFEAAFSFAAGIVGGGLDFVRSSFGGPVNLNRLKVGRGVEFAGVTFPSEFTWSGGRCAATPGDPASEVEKRIRAEDGSWWEPLPPAARDRLVEDLGPELIMLVDAGVSSGMVFDDVVFESRARFDHAFLSGARCVLRDVRCRDVCDFQGATLGGGHTLIQSSQFEQRLDIELGGSHAGCFSTTFVEGADIFSTGTSIAVEDCRFGRSSVIRSWSRDLSRTRATRLLSLRRTDCEHLRLLDMELSPCRFAGAHNLDKLVVEGGLLLESPPEPRFASRRRILAEEWDWRVRHDRWERPGLVGWKPGESTQPIALRDPIDLTTTEIAGLYRSLRKGSEDAKDEPGAADFYYGEMEMRRRTPGGGQRLILGLYWLLSGYALRPSRALASMVVTLALFAALFQSSGFADSPQLRAVRLDPGGVPVYERHEPQRASAFEQGVDAVVYTAGTATTVISGPERSLNRFGRVLRVVLRTIGPVLIALLILSVRGRVKR